MYRELKDMFLHFFLLHTLSLMLGIPLIEVVMET